MGKIAKAQKVWVYWFYDDNSKRRQISLNTSDKKEATRLHELIENSIAEGYDPMELFYATFGRVRKKYFDFLFDEIELTVAEVYQDYAHCMDYWSDWQIRWFNRFHIILMLEMLKKTGGNQHDLKTSMKVIGNLFSWAQARGYIFENPFDDITFENCLEILHTIDEYKSRDSKVHGEMYVFWGYPYKETKVIFDKYGKGLDYIAEITGYNYDTVRKWMSNKKRMPEHIKEKILEELNPQDSSSLIVYNQPSYYFGNNMVFMRRVCGWIDKREEYSRKEFAELLQCAHYTIASWECDKIPPRRRLKSLSEFFSDKFNTKITPDNLIHRDLNEQLFIMIIPPTLSETRTEIKRAMKEMMRIIMHRVAVMPKNRVGMLLNFIKLYTEGDVRKKGK